MNIYIDCGAYNGDTLNCEELFNFKADKKIAFEINPKFVKKLQADEVYHKAVWHKNETLTVFVDNSETPMGTTVFKSKGQKMRNRRIQVEAIDFPQFITDLKDNYIVVKMDIEGAEFPVLDKMLRNGTIKYIDKLYCEFHPNKVTEYTTTDKIALIDRLQRMTDFTEWH